MENVVLPHAGSDLRSLNSLNKNKILLDSLPSQAVGNRGGKGVSRGLSLSSPLNRSMAITAEQLLERVQRALFEKYGESQLVSVPGAGNPQFAVKGDKDPFSPEATSDRIVSGIKSIFAAYAKQNSSLSAEELISTFMEKALNGVDQGYSDAKGILQDNGILSVPGVESRAEATVGLVKNKLAEFEGFLREEYGLVAKDPSAESSSLTKDSLVDQANRLANQVERLANRAPLSVAA